MIDLSFEPSFWIGNIAVRTQTALAPMAGFADIPHRAICRAFGASLNYTEFVAAEEIIAGTRNARLVIDFTPDDRPLAIQIFGNDATVILDAALRAEQLGADIVDINLGCSTRRVSGRGAGVGMMRKPILVAETFALLTRHLSVPVTAKIRLGWHDRQNYLEIGRILQDNGAAMVAIHPRTKEQGYGGTARWLAIGALKQVLQIPVLGNGDIRSANDVARMLEMTGCDGVLVGRGAIGNPWLFAGIDKSEVTPQEIARVMVEHLQMMLDYHGSRGLLLFRKYFKRYSKGVGELESCYREMITADKPKQVISVLQEIGGRRYDDYVASSANQSAAR